MQYPIAIHKDDDSCYGVIVPDVPGCFGAGATFDAAMKDVRSAIDAHLSILADEGVIAPIGLTVDDYVGVDDYKGAIWAYVDVDISAYLGKTDKATVTLPRLLIDKIDAHVAAGGAKSRSAFLANSAAAALSRV